MSGISGPKIITSGCVLSLDAADKLSYKGSGTTWKDLSGNNNTGTLTNGPTFNAGNQGSIVFDGVDDYVSGTLPSLSDWTISIWYYSTDITTNSVYYPVSGTTTAAGLGFGGTFDANTQNRWYYFDGTNSLTHANPNIVINKWYNLVVTKNSTSYNLYTNSFLSVSGTLANQTLTQYNLGRRGDGQWYVKGRIACTLFYNRAITSTEVLQNYNATKTRFGL